MFSAPKDLSAPGRGAAQASASSNDYRIVLPRLPTGKLVVDSVFLHADLAGRPYRAQDFRDALRNVIDLKEISSIGQFQMSHVWMVTCKSPMAKSNLVTCGDLSVKGRRCIIMDPEPTEVKMKLLWLPERLEDAYIRDSLQAYGKVKSISAESWRVSEMEEMRTLNRDVVLSLADGVGVGDVPHLLPVCGVQSLVLIPGRPPLCLRCNKVGHIRRNCRTPRCEDCRRFGHTAEECVVTYADKLRHRTRPPDECVQEHIMDATEVLDATGDVPCAAETSCAGKSRLDVKDNVIAQPPKDKEGSKATDDQSKQQCNEAPVIKQPVPAQQAKEAAENESSASPKLLDTCPVLVEDRRSNADTSIPKRRATNTSETSTDSDTTSTTRKARRRKTSKHSGKCRRSRSRRPGGGSEGASPLPSRTDHIDN
ncbi:uncharacterized protein LOC125944606 [Dermacentor silvarum]|uniref:uncharacterized protein LOC125941680 n=1 Tax=Dermacentor silvarum TaxID=543639 RepID=UPI002101AA1A|nr:uncharacterized protein LOC125941680 [Dermacentor silvarum]XP_049521077.1 uncharacterized protein LOC125944606 [Dermacentor silvarum]